MPSGALMWFSLTWAMRVTICFFPSKKRPEKPRWSSTVSYRYQFGGPSKRSPTPVAQLYRSRYRTKKNTMKTKKHTAATKWVGVSYMCGCVDLPATPKMSDCKKKESESLFSIFDFDPHPKAKTLSALVTPAITHDSSCERWEVDCHHRLFGPANFSRRPPQEKGEADF